MQKGRCGFESISIERMWKRLFRKNWTVKNKSKHRAEGSGIRKTVKEMDLGSTYKEKEFESL